MTPVESGAERTGERRDRVGEDRHDVSEQVVEVEDDRQPADAHRHQHQHEQPAGKVVYNEVYSTVL